MVTYSSIEAEIPFNLLLSVLRKIKNMTSEQIVQKNLEFYNQRNIVGFMSLLAPNIKVVNFGESQAIVEGLEDVGTFYGQLFDSSPELHSDILKRIVIGNKVIDHEHIVGRNGSPEVVELVLIYEVEADEIVTITVLRE